jgi:hypothetical protein
VVQLLGCLARVPPVSRFLRLTGGGTPHALSLRVSARVARRLDSFGMCDSLLHEDEKRVTSSDLP